MELWDVYDINRSKTDKIMQSEKPFNADDYHLVVHVCIFNSKDEMLIQQRQPFKEGWPNMWDITVGGSAVAGETSQSAAERELFEETGIKLYLQKIRPHITINFDNGFDDIYLIDNEADIDKLTLQQEEVQNIRWASEDEILSMIDNGSFIPYYKSLIQLFFNMRKQYGCHCLK